MWVKIPPWQVHFSPRSHMSRICPVVNEKVSLTGDGQVHWFCISLLKSSLDLWHTQLITGGRVTAPVSPMPKYVDGCQPLVKNPLEYRDGGVT